MEEQNLRKIAEWLYIFLTTPSEVEKYVEMMQSDSSDNSVYCYNVEIFYLYDPKLQLTNTKPIIKNKLNELLSELKKLKVQKILVLEYKKRNDCKMFRSSVKLFLSDSDINEAFKSMTKI